MSDNGTPLQSYFHLVSVNDLGKFGGVAHAVRNFQVWQLVTLCFLAEPHPGCGSFRCQNRVKDSYPR